MRAIWAAVNDVPLIPLLDITLEKALTDNEKNAEGYVLTWPRAGRTPFRVKVKFVDFLRLQKLVHHIGPKQILDYMTQTHLQCYLDEVLNPETSHPEFIKYVQAWMERFNREYMRIHGECWTQHEVVQTLVGRGAERKSYAVEIRKRPYTSVLFAMLDAEQATQDIDRAKSWDNVSRCIWKQVEPVAAQQDDIRSLITQEE
jgi:hypothetical protein